MLSAEQYEVNRMFKTVQFNNQFHGTTATARARVGQYGYSISPRVAKRIYKELCGYDRCLCRHNLRGFTEGPNGWLLCYKGEYK